MEHIIMSDINIYTIITFDW